MKNTLLAMSLLSSMACMTATALAADCGSITIADVNSQSSDFLSSLDKYILNTGYGCNADVAIGGTVPSITSLVEKGNPNVVSEAWVDLVGEVVQKGIDENRISLAAPVFSEGGIQGWFIPKYLAEAHPDIKTIPDALKHPELFPNAENPSRGAIYQGPQGWGSTIVTGQLYKAYKAADAGFDIVDTGSAAGLDGSIAKAYERKEGWLGVYWAPTALLAKYPLVKLDAGAPVDEAEWKRCMTTPDCPDPKISEWPKDRVYTLVSNELAANTKPEVIQYLKTRSFTNDQIGELLLWMTENQATGEQGVKHFLETNPELWRTWVTAEAAKNIEASL